MEPRYSPQGVPIVLSLLATENIGGVSASSKANLVNINNLNCNSITCPAATISGQTLGGNLSDLTVQRTDGDKTYNGTTAIVVPAPSQLTIAHNSSDLLTYDPSNGSNVAVNIDCETLTMVVGTTTTTYDTTDPKTFNVDVYQGGENISIIENTGYTNHQTVSLVIGADIATNGNDIDL